MDSVDRRAERNKRGGWVFLRDDKQKNKQRQRQPQVLRLRCSQVREQFSLGMTHRWDGEGEQATATAKAIVVTRQKQRYLTSAPTLATRSTWGVTIALVSFMAAVASS